MLKSATKQIYFIFYLIEFLGYPHQFTAYAQVFLCFWGINALKSNAVKALVGLKTCGKNAKVIIVLNCGKMCYFVVIEI